MKHNETMYKYVLSKLLEVNTLNNQTNHIEIKCLPQVIINETVNIFLYNRKIPHVAIPMSSYILL